MSMERIEEEEENVAIRGCLCCFGERKWESSSNRGSMIVISDGIFCGTSDRRR
jgi:hypothetical protein